MLRRLSSALTLSLAMTLAPSVALALDGGSGDAGGDAQVDADAGTDGGLDAAVDAAVDASADAAKDAAKDSAVPAEDGGPITFRPDADTPTDDAGDLPGTAVDSGCSMASGGGTTGRDALAMVWVFALALASLVARRRTRRDARKAR
jgi:hypothetical protein